MFSKRNIKLREEKNRDEKQRFSIRKLTIGATSVLVGVSFFMYGAQSASAATTDDAPVVEKSATEPSKEDGNEVGESNNDSKNNTEINMENSNGSGEAQRDVTPGTQSEKTEISKKAKNSVETTDKATKNVDNQSPTQPSSTDNTVKTEKDNSESKRDSSLETGNKAASQNVIESHDKQTSPSVKTADEPKIVDNTHESTNVTTAENSKATQTENAPAVNNTTSTEIQNNARDIGSQKNTNSSTLASQDANSKINQKNANSDTIELKVPTANKKVEMSEDIDAKTVALNLKDTKHELTNNMNTVESEKIATSSVKNRAMLLTSLIAEDPNTVTVSDAKGFINAIQNGTATTINVAKDLNLASEYDGNYRQRVISHKRDILIQSATPGVKHTIDFSGNSFSMNTQNSVTFKDLDLYERSYWGIVYNAGGYVFDNVNFAGSQLIYTESSINSTLTFKNNVTATAVGSYTGPIDGESRPSQGGNTQQILQFVGGTNHIIFDENSNVTLGTTNSNVLEIDGGTTTIDVKNGANVTINPHSKGNPENRNSIGTGSIARAIASNANTTINVDKGANLTINTEKASGDSDVAGALYLNSDAKFNVNGNLNINSNGTPSTKNNGYPVYIAGNAAINVGNGGKFNLSATNTGSYSDNLMSISGKGTVKLAPHSNFKISADGTGALTAINLSSGSTFTSDQPDAFTIDLSQNTSTGKSLIRNGTINFSRVKTMATDGTTSEPLGKIDVTYDRNGNATTYTITSLNEDTVKQVGEGLANKNLIDFVKAGEDVTLSNLHLSKDNVLTGTVASSGSDNPIYVTVTVGGVSTNIPVVGNYTVYTNTKGTVTSNNVDYAAQTASTGGNFSIDLSKLASSLTNDAQVAVTATKDFVEAAQTKSVAALRALNIATLQELVDAAPEEEAKPSYYNATEEAQKAYTDAISTGKTILADQNNYDQVDVDAAVTAIQNAQKALTGKETNKTELQAAIDQASTVESSDNYTNADSNLQKAYTDAISAGQTVLNKENVTQSEVDNALTTINNAKAALNGDAKKAASKEALQKAVDEAPTVKSDDAAYYNGSDEAKAAYDKAISAGQTVLADPDATATQITDTLNAINTAKSNLKGKATDKAALQTAVDNSATVKESNNYTNADQTQKSAYDNAVTAAQTVLDKTNATQAEVNQALQDLETANNNLNGDAKTEAANKAALEAAVKDAPNVRNTPAYYNGSEEAQTAYNSAINAGQAVLDQANPSANDVKTALDKINAARANLKGVATNTEALEKALTNANDAKKTGNYTNADQANQEALNNAITAGQEILKNTNATQAQIDSAAKAITDAISGLNGDTNLTNAKNAATEDIQKALDTKTTEITDATNIDQATKDQLIADAKKAAEDANTAINQATNADAVNTAKTEGITNINNVTVPSLDDAKTNAAKKIDQALTNKTKEINNAENIDQTTKDQLIKEATDAANTAKDAIEKATTNDEATKAGQAGVDAIKKIVPTSLDTVKSNANKAIDDALTKKLEEINSANNLTTDEKTALTQEANTAADKAKEEIANATTNDAVIEAQNNGVSAIDGIKVPTESAVKEAAKKAVADAATAKNQAIDASNLTDEEKAALKQKVTDVQNAADQAIDNATTNAAVTEAQTNGIKAINGIELTTSTVKEVAKKAVADAATAKNNAIDASNLTDEEKAALKQKVTEAQNAADQAIDNATTNAAVTEAQTNGVNAINGIEVPTTSATKEQAITDLNAAVDDAKKAIDQDSNLTDEEKQAAKDQIDTDATKAQEAINNAKTNDDVKKAGDSGTLAIDKDVANAAIDNAVAGKKAEISKTPLTDEEKTALNNEVDQKAQEAKEAINNATTPEAVTTAQDSGVNNINETSVPSESAAKQAAKEAVAKAVDEKNAAIDSSNLTEEEKAALKQKVTEAQTAADQAIDNATTNAAVTEAQTNGVNAINGIEVPNKSDAKEQAITDLNTAVDNAKKAIDQDSNLTDEEKQAAKDQIDSDAKNAQDAINNAKTNDDVKKAADDGTLAIDKDVANAAIDNAVAGKKAEISNSPLTDEEKNALNNEVNQKGNTAKEAINTATTPEAVSTAQESGVKNINDTSVPAESAAKQAAKEAVTKAADEKNAAIDASNLTDEEKAALKQKVTDAQTAADQAIDNASTNAAVTEAQNKGVSAIGGIEVPTTSANKEKAITDLNNEVENAKKAIDQDSNLTDEEKQAVKDQIDSDAKIAQDAINNAKTDNDVNDAVNNGKVSIDKDVANAAIDDAVAGKLKEIQDPLTTEEKQAYTDLINSEATNAKQNIANATTVEEVTTAQTNGVNEITNTEIPTTSSAKDKAIAAINDALQKKTDEINNASNINTQEKTDLINQANEAANAAKNNINNATTNANVDTAQTNGEKAIADVTVPNLSDVKKESIDLINKALDAKTNEINNASNLSQDEKQGLINDATNAATEAINNVNQAQTNDDAKAAATTGVQNIENITIPTLDEAKKNANQAIDDALNSKVNEINNASNLNETEKQKLVDQANEAATTAKNNVEKATTNDDARDAANAGIDNIKGITFTSLEDAKNAANTAIDNALQVKTDEINNASNLSTDEKQDLINQATEVAKNAKDNINNATTNDAVTEAQNKGIADIANVSVPSLDQVKQDAINAIKQVQDAKNKQISAASNLSAEEQKELSDQVDKIANDAIAKINDSSTTTNDAVTATRDDAVKQITDLFIPTLDGAQTDAFNAIESAKNAKLNDINNAAHLTDQEKQALVDQTNKAADDAAKEIKAAQTNDAVKSAETAGLDNINNITIPTLVQKQQEAIEELNAARDAKNSAIDNATDLTTDEKNSLKDKVQAEYSNAVSNITSATTDEAVKTAKEDGIAAIKDIQIPTKSPAKEQATSDLNTAVDEAKNAIDQDNNLTDEEKQAAKDQIDSDAKKAQEAIDNATTDDEVNTAVDNGKLAIDKDIANAAIDNAVAGKKAEISNSPLTDEEKTALNNEVDQKAQAAKEALNNAITPEAVTTAQENGIKNITDTEVPTASTAKEAAKKAVAEAAEAKNNAIDSSNLTAEEKAALKQEVTDAQSAAAQAIDNATTNAGVTEAQENGIKAIDNVTVPAESATKEAAKKAVAEAADAKNNAIDSSNLTAEEKAALKQEVAEAQNAANTAIDNATTNAEVTEAEDNGIKAINSIEVPTKSDAKEQATTDLNTAVDEAKKAIDQDSNLTDEEKQAAKDRIDSDAKKAQEAIDTAKTNDDVKSAIDDGTLAIDKDVANAAINNAVAGKKEEISKSSLTDEEKTALSNEVDEKANTAKDAINNATTPEDVTTAQEDGIKNINNTEVPTESAAKEAAKKAVAEAADAKNNAIDSSNLTDEEKSALKQEVTEAQNAANTAIDNATTNAEVTEAQDNGVKTINGIEVPTKSTTKEQATTDLNNEVEDAKKAVDQDNNLTDEQKQAAKDQIDSDAKKAQDAINNAKTNDDVKKAVDDGKLVIDKDVANAAIDNAVAGKKDAISKSPLTDEEKTALNNEVDQKAQDAKEAINNATTPEAVSSAQDTGIKNINGTEVPSVSPAKTAAKEAVQKAATDKITAINNASSLTKEEKSKLVDQVNNIVTQADANIDKATTNAVVEEAQENGISDINNIEIPTTSSSKDQAANTIDQAADEAKKVIDATPGLTDDQKQAAKDQIDQDAENTKNNIAKATDDQGVQDATDAGLLDIDKVTAKTAVDSAAAIKKDEISKAPLTTDEANNLNDLVDAEAQAAKDAIDGATTIPAVEDAKNTGVDTINNIQVPTTSPAKANANQAIDNALANKTQEINDASNLSDKQKQDLIDKATQEAEKAKDNIQNATSDEAVNQATDNGVEAIANITVPSLDNAKQDATQLIDDVLKQKEDEINNATHLTDEEKNDLIKQAEDAANEAKDKINQSTTNDDVAKERDTGIEKITNIKVPSLDDAKKNASKAIDDALEDKTKEINDQSNLSDKEKNNLIDQVTEIANKAKDKINHDVTNAEIAKDEKEGIDEIVNTKVPGLDDHKRNAIDSLDEAKTTKLTQISNATNLTAKEKNQLTQQVNIEYTKALDNINKATTNSEADQASANGVEAILNIEIPSLSEKKQNSVDALNEVREAKKEEINSATNLSQDEKDKLTKQVDQIADNAINAINGAKDDQAVKDAEDKGIHDILDVKIPSLDEVKNNAKQAIADALESKTKQINAATNLDPTTKQDLINQANDIAEKANKNIDKATSNDAVLKAADEGVNEINSINIPSLDSALEQALNAIQDALTNKLDEINKATYLPQSERNELINQANKTAEDAVNAVNAAKTNSAVQEAASEGVKKINAIVVPAQVIDNNTPSNNDQTNTDQTTLEQDKNQAIDSINNSLNNKVSEINNASHLTNEEKQNLIDQATAAADKAKEAINNATDATTVKKAMNQGVKRINSIEVLNKVISKKDTSQNSNNGNQVEKTHSRSHANRKRATKETKSTSLNAQNPKSDSNLNKIAKNKKVLPQTGSKQNEGLVALGLLAAGIAGLISVLGSHKKKD
ncbi:DUF1542 domain-containing protein [Lactobacillus intestinalis]|uniref:DUF1542 domain-containing protein n=1 Tax=Lactobacillus intestinalis TaxID=151781 RepID=UPI0035119EEF